MCKSVATILFAGAFVTTHSAFAQRVEVTSTTTTSDGTISEFGPQGLMITTTAGTQPVRYISNDTTNYVDQDGNPVASTTVRSGLPVTVYYTKVGDTLIASKIMVRRVAGVPVGSSIVTTQSSTSSAGTISEFGPGTISVRTESSPDPLRYTYSKTTTYTDESGAPVSIETVKSGLPVTVYYTKVGGAFVASKVIVRRAVTDSNQVIERKTTTTTTTTNK